MEGGTRGRTLVLPNPVDADRVRELARPLPSPGECFRFCSVGRLATQKGHDLLLRAFAIAAPQLGEWECLVIGEGQRREELESLSEQLGLPSKVKFLGYETNPYPLIASADAFVHSARYEPFGVVLLEALALGCPVVAFACPGAPPDILANGEFGIAIPAENIREFADALVRIDGMPICGNDSRSPGRNGQRVTRPRWSPRELSDLST